ncbi:MAG TPA: GDP-mannose 4,6-dehydratase [Methylomirabilota bacterium]|nr:GDP-mannose 4,6-dehydratase [Methylomirabilota bacterium]
MKKILVTGANGFVGQHLVKELSDNGMEVVGIGGQIGSTSKSPYVSEYFVIDLNDAEAVKQIDFRDIDGVVHLAGLAAIGPSFENPMDYINTNIGIQANMFEAALEQGAKPTFLIISSGSLYDAKAEQPLTETSKVIPSSPYAVSKIGQEQMAGYYGERGFTSIIARPFNHIGPGQNPGFIVPDVAQQIVAYERGETDKVTVGNLDGRRDYTDVRDIVRAYRLLLEKGVAGETYNICSGKDISGHDIVSGLLKAAGSKIPVEQDPKKMRPSDTPVFTGNNHKIIEATGWQPSIPLEQTLADVIADWRQRD